MTREQSNPDPDPLDSTSTQRRDYLRLLLATLGVGALTSSAVQPAQAAHLSSAPYPSGAWGSEVITGHGLTDRPSISELDDAWSETYHFIFVDVDNDQYYYVEKDDTTWTDITAGGGGGGSALYNTVVSKSSDYTASDGEYILIDASDGTTKSVILPSPTDVAVVGVKKTDTTDTIVRLEQNAADNIDNNAALDLNAENESVSVISDGTDWYSFGEVGSFDYIESLDVIDDFEDGNLSEYTGDQGNFTVDQTSPVKNGSWSLKHDISGGRLISTSGLDSYPSAGNAPFRVWNYIENAQTGSQFLFGVQDINNFYYVGINTDSNVVALIKKVSDSNTTVDSASQTFKPDQWYDVEIDWDSDGSIVITVFDTNDVELVSFTTSDTTYSSGGIGFSGQVSYYDYVRFV